VFLEYEEDTACDHDIFRARREPGKPGPHEPSCGCRPERVIAKPRILGFEVRREPGFRGMVSIIADDR